MAVSLTLQVILSDRQGLLGWGERCKQWVKLSEV